MSADALHHLEGELRYDDKVKLAGIDADGILRGEPPPVGFATYIPFILANHGGGGSRALLSLQAN